MPMASFFSNIVESIQSAKGAVGDYYQKVVTSLGDNVTISGREYRIHRLLGAGGFSLVYLVQDHEGQYYALKKMECQLREQVAHAHREIENYRRFESDHIISMLDHATVTAPNGRQIVYLLLPFYRRGNLQDIMDRRKAKNVYFSETRLLRMFLDVCDAVRVMHTHRDKPTSAEAAAKLMPWAHRDIKPGNILLSDDGNKAVIMDLGSACPARIPIHNKKEALREQDIAAEHSSLPYRAPELLDVKVDCVLDEKVDIWSLGCTLYAMAYGQSPFDMSDSEQGGSVTLAVMNGRVMFPKDHDRYSQPFKDFILAMINPNVQERPTIYEVISQAKSLLNE
ncbi:kinase-like domain-containing protein [Radiomyces spectabilis]|uniref:kinase-like domain-containing protein n=1 Tax=Radiomyces spectabilis TaxID=64574 RepID=UPI00221F1056|nr:kinase-like domain-containing protein [Radiomyces spectabilis]KAI8393879.1 kinase-like domain-containing protein [Radiomyces spectabilis]